MLCITFFVDLELGWFFICLLMWLKCSEQQKGKKGSHVTHKNINPLDKKHSCIGETLERWSWRFLLDLFWYGTVALNKQLQNGPKDLLVECHDFLLDSEKIKASVFQANSRPSEGKTAHQTLTSSVFAIKQRKKRPQRTWKKHIRRA